METLSQISLDNIPFADSASLAAYLRFEIKVASGGAVTPPADNEDEDIDGCEVQVAVPTSDEELPAAEGGVA